MKKNLVAVKPANMTYEETANLELVKSLGADKVIDYTNKDRRYSLEHIVEAHKYVEKEHKRGHVVITVEHAYKAYHAHAADSVQGVSTMIWIAVFIVLGLFGGSVLLRWGTRWGSIPEERAREMPGDEYLKGDRRARVAMTRAISISARPDRVWPWIVQLGRGAGWYSVDWLDNGRKISAWHIVSWIPEPRLGDATAIGYLRHVTTGRSLTWWIDDARFLGSRFRMVTCYGISAEGQGTRVISRISADATGPMARIFLMAFRAIDSIMACRQLIGLRDRVEYCEKSQASLRDPETGERDQYQLYEVLYANGDRAGIAGKEEGAKWRQSAIRDGLLEEVE